MLVFRLFSSISVLCLVTSYPLISWFTANKIVNAQFDISEECLSKVKDGDCSFFECFEERLPCGEDGYALSYGKKYCNKLKENSHLFTSQGQEFIRKMAICQIERSLSAYNSSFLDCNQHYATSFRNMGLCFVPSGFCHIVIPNLVAVASSLDPSDFINYRLVTEVFAAGRNCPVDLTSDIVREYMNYKRR